MHLPAGGGGDERAIAGGCRDAERDAGSAAVLADIPCVAAAATPADAPAGRRYTGGRAVHPHYRADGQHLPQLLTGSTLCQALVPCERTASVGPGPPALLVGIVSEVRVQGRPVGGPPTLMRSQQYEVC